VDGRICRTTSFDSLVVGCDADTANDAVSPYSGDLGGIGNDPIFNRVSSLYDKGAVASDFYNTSKVCCGPGQLSLVRRACSSCTSAQPCRVSAGCLCRAPVNSMPAEPRTASSMSPCSAFPVATPSCWTHACRLGELKRPSPSCAMERTCQPA
jgi:hypothetical protein